MVVFFWVLKLEKNRKMCFFSNFLHISMNFILYSIWINSTRARVLSHNTKRAEKDQSELRKRILRQLITYKKEKKRETEAFTSTLLTLCRPKKFCETKKKVNMNFYFDYSAWLVGLRLFLEKKRNIWKFVSLSFFWTVNISNLLTKLQNVCYFSGQNKNNPADVCDQ